MRCYSNLLTGALDVSTAPNLTELIAFGNQFSSVDISNNPPFADVNLEGNLLTTIDLSGAPGLLNLNVGANQLTVAWISAATPLQGLAAYANQLTGLNTTANTQLVWLILENQITSLDLYQPVVDQPELFLEPTVDSRFVHFPLLNELDCRNNNLTSLLVNNGNNSNFISFLANGNASLCLVFRSITGYIPMPTGAAESTRRHRLVPIAPVSSIPDADFKNTVPANAAINTNSDGEIQCYKMRHIPAACTDQSAGFRI